jgi:putative sigma-54 modulation protein
MIKTNLTARGVEIDAKLKGYVEAQLSSLDKYLPRQVRETALIEVILSEDASGREDNSFVCEAIITVKGATLTSSEGTINLYSSIDVVEAKLKAQLRTYKEKHTTEPRRAKMLTRLMGRTSETDPATPALD